MSIVKDLSESHNLLKCISISIFPSVLWYISIKLLHPSLYNDSDLIFKVCLCTVISLCSVLPIALLINNTTNKANRNIVEHTIITSILYFIYKSIYLFITYSLLYITSNSIVFYWYILLSYLILILILGIISLVLKLS